MAFFNIADVKLVVPIVLIRKVALLAGCGALLGSVLVSTSAG